MRKSFSGSIKPFNVSAVPGIPSAVLIRRSRSPGLDTGLEMTAAAVPFSQGVHKGPAYGRLADAPLARDGGEPLALGDGVTQVGERFLVMPAEEEVGRVRGELEGVVLEAEELEEHDAFLGGRGGNPRERAHASFCV